MTLEQLIKDYKRRMATAENMLTERRLKPLDKIAIERLKTKAAEYRAFLSDLEKLKPDFEFEGTANTYSNDTVGVTDDGIYCGTDDAPYRVPFKFEEGKHYRITIKKLQ